VKGAELPETGEPIMNEQAKSTTQVLETQLSNTVVQGDCIAVMRRMAEGSADFVLTDPPYLVRYRSRDGRSIANDKVFTGIEYRELIRI